MQHKLSLSSARLLMAGALAATLAAVPATAWAEPGPWPGFHGDSAHTGLGTVAGPRALTLGWYVNTGDDVDNAAVIASDGTVFISSTDGTVQALNPDGSQRWTKSPGGRLYGSPVLGIDGKVLIADHGGRGAELGRFRALDPNDGSTSWVRSGYGNIRSTAAVGADGTIYFGTDRGELVGLNSDGTDRFRTKFASDAILGAPAIDARGFVYFGSLDTHLRRLTAAGDVIWDVSLDGPIYSAPSVGPDGTVYVGSGSSLLAVNSDSGSVKWRVGLDATVATTPAVGADGTVYAGADNGVFDAVNPSGTLRWQYKTGGTIRSSAAVGPDGVVYLGSGDSFVYALDSAGRMLSTYRALDAVRGPVTLGRNGMIFVGSRDNRFYALKDSARRFTEAPVDRLGGDLVRDAATGRVYVIVDGQRRRIPDPATQLILGLAGPLPLTATATELLRYPEGAPLPALAEGAVIRAANGPLYVIKGGQRMWIRTADDFAAGGYSWDNVVNVEDRVLRTIPLKLEDGMLLKGSGDRIYVLTDNQRRWVSSAEVFNARGYNWSLVHFISETALSNLTEGPQL